MTDKETADDAGGPEMDDGGGNEPVDNAEAPETAGDGPTSADTFALIGNEIRAAIIRILGEALAPEDREPKLKFSEIRSRMDMDVNPSQLNYHLKQLVGPFVTRFDDGYQLRPEGINLYWTLRAGTFEQSREGMTVSAEFDCYYCETTVEATSNGSLIRVECPECEFNYLTDIVEPPLETFEDESEAFAHFSKYFRNKVLGWADGICSMCGNAVGAKFVSPEDKPGWGERRAKAYVYGRCSHCGEWIYLTVGMAMLCDPQVLSFCYERDLEVLSTPVWELGFATTDASVTVNSTDPWEVAFHVEIGEDALELVLDETVSVVERNLV